MGLTTSRPLIEDTDNNRIDAEVYESDHDIATSPLRREEEGEGVCWKYLLRFVYRAFGYSSSSSADLPRSRKRRLSDVEDAIADNSDSNRINNSQDTHSPEGKIARVSIESSKLIYEDTNTQENYKTEVNTNELVTETDNSTLPGLPYLQFPFLIEDTASSFLSGSKTMFVMRGLPGSGKSTVVKQIQNFHPQSLVCSADQYFINENGHYEFDASLLKEAHSWCQSKAKEACEADTHIVIIDNTGVKKWELVPYFKMASQNNYAVVLVEPKTPWKFHVDELLKRNVHKVDRFILNKRIKDWENVYPLYYGWFLHATDTKHLLDIVWKMIFTCLDTFPKFMTDVSDRTGFLNNQGIRSNYSRNEYMCHCTSRFPKNEHKGMEYPPETEMLGTVSCIKIVGFILTPRTVGARVLLNSEQLTVYHQNDFDMSNPNQSNTANSNKSPLMPKNNAPNYESCTSTLKHENNFTVNISDFVGPIKGRRAHITLGCAPGIKPVQTGPDQLDTLAALDKQEAGDSHAIQQKFEGGTLYGVGSGRWAIQLTHPISVKSLYTGGY